MLSVLRSLRTVPRHRATFNLMSLPTRTYLNRHPQLSPPPRILQKFEARVNIVSQFHTTSPKRIHPVLVYLMRPLANLFSFLVGRYIKNWWSKLPPDQKATYKKWFASKKGVFLGIFAAFLSSLGIYYVRHLETDPLTGRRRFILFDQKQRDALAKLTYEMHLELHKNNLVAPDDRVHTRIKSVVINLLKANKDLPFVKDPTWTLNVVNENNENAYVLPGGHIFVFAGILKMVENDDQLAFVLAHEVAHVLLNHNLEQVSNTMMFELLMALPAAALWAIVPDILVGILVQQLGKLMLRVLFTLPYQRELEREADDVGLTLAARACVDVREAVVFWRTMKALTEMGVAQEAEHPWLSTHPDNEEREKFLDAKMPAALKFRLESGCHGLPRSDPRDRPRITKDQKGFLQRRGYELDVFPKA